MQIFIQLLEGFFQKISWFIIKLKQEMLLQLVITIDFCVKRDLVNIQKVNEMWYVWDMAENRKKIRIKKTFIIHTLCFPQYLKQ